MSGKLIVFEGIDGSGKSTQLKLTAQWLQSLGFTTISTCEPGGTRLGHQIRHLLLTPQESNSKLSGIAELLLYAADRAQHVAEIIKPALARDHWVLCDRFTSSTIAYQGAARGNSIELINTINSIASCNVSPDLTLWLAIDPDTAHERLQQSGKNNYSGGMADLIESEGLEFQRKVSASYIRQYSRSQSQPDNIIFRVNAHKDMDCVQLQIRECFRNANQTRLNRLSKQTDDNI